MSTISHSMIQASRQLESVSDSARIDAELLLCAALKKNRSFLHAWPERELEPAQQTLFSELLQRRLQGEPIAHILGQREFWTLNLKVTRDTLIPRPETELLVEQALKNIPGNEAFKILDLGTGTGAIALSIASERPACEVTATDVSANALAVAKQNALSHQVENITFIQSRWFSGLSNQQFDIIVSNPPYIPEADPHLVQGDVRFEPRSALTSGIDGLDDIREIIRHSHSHLTSNGILLLEHGYDQAEAVCGLLKTAGFHRVTDIKDYNDQPRVAIGHRNK